MRTEHGKDDPYIRAGVILAVILFACYVYPGFLIPVTPHFDGSCETIPLELSAEDLRIDPGNGLAYLTYFDNADVRRRRKEPASAGTTGTVMLVDLNSAEPHVRAALSTEPAGFMPSGLSLYTAENGTKRLFVTNRTELGKHSVEVFDQSATGAFTPAETIRDRLLWSPTAIVAVGPRQFYVVNVLGFKRSYEDREDKDERRGPGRLRGNQSTVVYYDGGRMKIVASRLNLASGIAISPDGRTVYVAESGGRRIQAFERDLASGNLKPTNRIHIPGAPRNLAMAEDGTLWVSAHPSMLSSFGLDDSDEGEPTQVLKVTPGAAPDKQVEEVYVGKGSELSAGTVVVPRNGNQFVVGSGSDHKLLMCTRGAAPTQTAKEF
jgi:sugar lactone lactonase YvrE